MKILNKIALILCVLFLGTLASYAQTGIDGPTGVHHEVDWDPIPPPRDGDNGSPIGANLEPEGYTPISVDTSIPEVDLPPVPEPEDTSTDTNNDNDNNSSSSDNNSGGSSDVIVVGSGSSPSNESYTPPSTGGSGTSGTNSPPIDNTKYDQEAYPNAFYDEDCAECYCNPYFCEDNNCDEDTDNDQMPDCVDHCPGVYGDDLYGCPPCDQDEDGDGSPDCEDKCPYVYGDGPTGCPIVHIWYFDGDGDGFHSQVVESIENPGQTRGWSLETSGIDCDDGDENANTPKTWYYDYDGDGWYTDTQQNCTSPGDKWTTKTPKGKGDGCPEDACCHTNGRSYYVDADGDGVPSNTVVHVCPANATNQHIQKSTYDGAFDCDDTRKCVTTNCKKVSFYIDKDGDGWYSLRKEDYPECNFTPSIWNRTSSKGFDCNDDKHDLLNLFCLDTGLPCISDDKKKSDPLRDMKILPTPSDVSVRGGRPVNGDYGGRGARGHNGIDLAAPPGTPIYAPYDGKITGKIVNSWPDDMGGEEWGDFKALRRKAGLDVNAGGNRFRLAVNVDGVDYEIAFYHLQKDGQLFKRGDEVSAGQIIGYTGATGSVQSGESGGPHVHVEFWKNGNINTRVDPKPFFFTSFDEFGKTTNPCR